MKKLFTKICCGAAICGAILAFGVTSVFAAGVAAKYTKNSSGAIYAVTNKSTATYANIDANVSTVINYNYGTVSFSSDVTSGGVSYYQDSGSSKYRYNTGVFSDCSKLKYVNIENGVTELGYNVFFNNKNISTIVFPNNKVNFKTSLSVESSTSGIYYTAYYNTPTFGYMRGLERYYCSTSYSVTLPYGTKMTYNYNDGTLLYKLKSDGTYEVLYALPGNTTVNIPDTANNIKVTSIADNAFNENEDLTTLTIPSTITSIGANAFKGLTDLKSVMIPSSVTSIGDYAFAGCTSLSSVYIASSADMPVSIGNYAFYNCTSLTSAVLTANVQSVGDYCFYNSGITSITIPASMTSIGTAAFSGCRNLASITVSSNNTSFTAQDNVLFDKGVTRLMSYGAGKSDSEYIIPATVRSIDTRAFASSKTTNITIPENIESIGSGAFTTGTPAKVITCKADSPAADTSLYPSGSSVVTITPDSAGNTFTVTDVLGTVNLEKYNIPRNYYSYICTAIGDSAFNSCSGLTEITIPDSVRTIGTEAFMGCTALNNVDIPSGVESIGGACFAGCTGLNTISIAPGVVSIGDGCFFNCPTMNVTCEQGSAADDASLYPSGSVIEYTLYVIKGDINDDGSIDAADAVLALRYGLGSLELDEAQLRAGDVNNDDVVDAADADLIVKYDTGEIAAF